MLVSGVVVSTAAAQSAPKPPPEPHAPAPPPPLGRPPDPSEPADPDNENSLFGLVPPPERPGDPRPVTGPLVDWVARAPGDVGATPVAAGRLWVVPLAAGWLVAVERRTGREAWRLRLPGRPLSVAATAEGIVYAATDSGALLEVEPARGAVRGTWRVGLVEGAPPGVDGDRVLLRTTAGLALLDKVSRALRIVSVPGGGARAFLVTDGRAVVASAASGLFGVELETGRTSWSLATTSPSSCPLVVWKDPVEGSSLVLVGTASGLLLAVDPEAGEVRWRSAGTAAVVGVRALEREILVTRASRTLERVAAADGRLLSGGPVGGYPVGAAVPVEGVQAAFAQAFAGGGVEFLSPGLRRVARLPLGSTPRFPPTADGDGVLLVVGHRLLYRLASP